MYGKVHCYQTLKVVYYLYFFRQTICYIKLDMEGKQKNNTSKKCPKKSIECTAGLIQGAGYAQIELKLLFIC